MSAFQITRIMVSVVKKSSSDQLGGFVLKGEQKLAVDALLSEKIEWPFFPLVSESPLYIKAS